MENILNEIYSTKSLSELNVLKEKISEAITKHTNTMTIKESAFNAIKGSLGSVKESFENMSPELFKTNDGRKLIATYKNIVKENKSLSKALSIYENFRKAINENTISYVINDIEKYTKAIDIKKLNEGINDLKDVLFSSYILLGEDAKQYCNNINETYNNAIMFIIENKHKLSNSIEFANASEIIKECVRNRVNENNNNFHTELIENISDAFDNYFEDGVSEDVPSTVNSTKEKAFEEYKKECMNKINEVITSMENNENTNNDELLKIKTIYEQVSEKKYSPENVNNDITNLIGITKCFE